MTSARRLPDPVFWAGKRVLLTGHTGFKGTWTALWLEMLGASVTGFSLPPATEPNLFNLVGIAGTVCGGFGDLRRARDVAAAVERADPQLVLHMAAQPLVRQSLADPVETYASNVMGTVHLLDALRGHGHLEAILVTTTDKVYRNDETGRAFAEADRLGGHDPYAASKAATELVVASYAASFFDPAGVPLATARGGNVIGGGDFSVDRIVPDIWRALRERVPLVLRYPEATRPWQHVLDCVAGYLLYVEALARDRDMPRAMNFGPCADDTPMTVAALAETMQTALGVDVGWVRDTKDHPREMRDLAIDPTLARGTLGWSDGLVGRAAIEATAQWYRALEEGADMRVVTKRQIERYGMSS